MLAILCIYYKNMIRIMDVLVLIPRLKLQHRGLFPFYQYPINWCLPHVCTLWPKYEGVFPSGKCCQSQESSVYLKVRPLKPLIGAAARNFRTRRNLRHVTTQTIQLSTYLFRVVLILG